MALKHEDGSIVLGPRKDLKLRSGSSGFVVRNSCHMANPKLKKKNVRLALSPNELSEWRKCRADPVYFIRTFMKIVNVDGGLMPFDMYDFQENMIRHIEDNRFSILLTGRQCGKCVEYNTLIHIRNKHTNTIEKIAIGDLHKLIKSTVEA